jgi:hypothetical protein
MDIDSTVAPARAAAESASAGTTLPEVVVPEGTAASGSAPRAAAADAPAGEVIKEAPTSSATTPGGEPAASVVIPTEAPVEDVVVGGLKESLVRATQLELRLRELASEAELVKSTMHVSTYVSFRTHWV